MPETKKDEYSLVSIIKDWFHARVDENEVVRRLVAVKIDESCIKESIKQAKYEYDIESYVDCKWCGHFFSKNIENVSWFVCPYCSTEFKVMDKTTNV